MMSCSLSPSLGGHTDGNAKKIRRSRREVQLPAVKGADRTMKAGERRVGAGGVNLRL